MSLRKLARLVEPDIATQRRRRVKGIGTHVDVAGVQESLLP